MILNGPLPKSVQVSTHHERVHSRNKSQVQQRANPESFQHGVARIFWRSNLERLKATLDRGIGSMDESPQGTVARMDEDLYDLLEQDNGKTKGKPMPCSEVQIITRFPSSALLPFLGGGLPTKIGQRKKGTLIRTSLLEDLVGISKSSCSLF